MKRRDLNMLLSFGVVTGVVSSEILGNTLLSSHSGLIGKANAQDLAETYVGIDAKANYLNTITPSPIDILVEEAHASHLNIPNPWSIKATRVDDSNYEFHVMDKQRKTLQVATINVDGTKTKFDLVKESSCKKLKQPLIKAHILSIGPDEMLFEAWYKKVGQLNWILVPGDAAQFPGPNC